MKKILLALAVIATVSLVSCKGGDNKAQEASVEQTDTTAAAAAADSITPEEFKAQLDQAVANKDTAAIKVLIGKSQTTYQKLVATDKTAADAYAKAVQDALKANTALSTVVPNAAALVNEVVALPSNAKNAAEATGKAIADSAKSAAKQTVNAAKEAAAAKANQAVEKARQETVDKANKEVEKAQKKANDAVNNAQKKAADAVKKGLGL